MPILQNKLVIKSIEALHDEVLALMPDSERNSDVARSPSVLHAAALPQGLPAQAPENAPSESAGDHNIMARIDHLLEKLDEDDDVRIAPPAKEGSHSNTGNVTDNVWYTKTLGDINTNNLANPNNPILPDATDHANGGVALNTAADDMAKDLANEPLNETSDISSMDAYDDTFSNDQPGEAAPPTETQALADIAEAIYQARQQAIDSGVAGARQNNTTPFDLDTLSATVADEVRRTVSEVITAELPQMVRDAVRETIRTLPTEAYKQSTLTNSNPSTAKGATPRKTAAIRKPVKAGTKKAINKTTQNKKLSAKKSKAKKATAKKTATLT